MAAVTIKRLFRPLVLAGIAAIIVGCPMDLALKTTIKGLAAPPDVGSPKMISPASKTFQLSWVDPSDKDIDHIELSFVTPFATNTPPANINVAVGVQKATVNVPLNGVWYFITIKTVDKAGNKSPGKTPVNFFSNIFGTSKTVYFTSGLPVYQQYYSVSGGVLPGTPSGYYAYTYSGGNSGNRTNSSYYYPGTYPSGTLYSHDAYTYDSNGNMTKDAYYYDTPPNTLQYYYVYTYDTNGNMTAQGNYSSTGVEGYNSTYSYDSNGNLTSVQQYSSPGVETSTDTFSYDQNNRLVTVVFTDLTNSANSGSYTITWNSTTNFPSKIVIASSGISETLTYTVTQTSFTQTSSYSTSTYSSNSTYTQNFNSYGLEVQDTSNGSYTSSGTTTTYSDTYTYNYDINGNKTDEVDYYNGTANSHYTWPQYY